MTPVLSPVWADPQTTARLCVDSRATVPAWVATTRDARNTGLLRTTGLDGALLIERCGSVHTIGMQYPIDVVFLSAERRVVDVVTMRPGRIGRPRLRARSVVELPAAAAARLGIVRGSVVTVEEVGAGLTPDS
ncbi:DUF192 domain-containing protein [Sanguibacter suarezii]|uniref:DUF192 domain-containing protein n=1 Tax=Sanguibacter suarezii TaxID=60921 RepID=UPI0009FF16C6|nr:DUF192 domain-containing protein [Sanguibacter suarezii]